MNEFSVSGGRFAGGTCTVSRSFRVWVSNAYHYRLLSARFDGGEMVLTFHGEGDLRPAVCLDARVLWQASDELRAHTALLIAGLMRADVYADRLQEEFPDLEPVAAHLREWHTVTEAGRAAQGAK